MRRFLLLVSAWLLAGMGICLAQLQEPAAPAAEGKISPEDAAKKNPIKATPEGLAEARKLYGYDCAMCHGKTGDGKGELAESMKLQLKDWRDPDALANVSDGEIFYVVTNGKGKMVGGEGDRSSEKVRWNLVHLLRSFARKGGAEKPATDAGKP
jgi:mono/diheme cytochrome c family protein